MAEMVREDVPLRLADIDHIAGTDVSYLREEGIAVGVALSFSWPGLELLEERVCVAAVEFPYVPGLLSFRELPALLPALRSLAARPGLVMVDGQGVAHPRRFGLASHLGVALGLPTLGCAKSRLVGEHAEPGPLRGDWTPLLLGGRTVGAVLRTRDGVKPLFVSAGHLIDLQSSVAAVLACGRGYRLPEPQRLAHALTARLKEAYRRRGMAALREEAERHGGCAER
jgi:deoxyribonuclease V